jgi:hypothetical protein
MGRPKKNIIGGRYGRLSGIKFLFMNHLGQAVWLFKCDCGRNHEAVGSEVTRGNIKSCGCLNDEVRSRKFVTHGLWATFKSEHIVWSGMISRCTKTNSVSYERYGGRGITVSNDWLKFENFVADMGRRPSPKHTIERRNNNEGYSKSNCSWELEEVQGNNKRNNVKVEWIGKKQTISQWANEIGLAYGTLYRRIILYKWPLERAFIKENNIRVPRPK